MYNSKKTITPSEINKYMYCPYQWYYERMYGAKELRRLKKEAVSSLNITGSSNNRFQKGLRFHKNYMRIYRIKRIAMLVGILLLIFILYITMWK